MTSPPPSLDPGSKAQSLALCAGGLVQRRQGVHQLLPLLLRGPHPDPSSRPGQHRRVHQREAGDGPRPGWAQADGSDGKECQQAILVVRMEQTRRKLIYIYTIYKIQTSKQTNKQKNEKHRDRLTN